MLKVENVETYGWEAAIRGMRNPMNSWEKSDSYFYYGDEYHDIPGNTGPSKELAYEDDIGLNDEKLMLDLCKGGPVHAKFRRMLTITMDITAPLYWWKEFDTYKVGTVANSCSTMHKIHAKEFELDDFSHEHLDSIRRIVKLNDDAFFYASSNDTLLDVIRVLNIYRELFLETKDKAYWWQMIQLLPSSYNQFAHRKLLQSIAKHMPLI